MRRLAPLVLILALPLLADDKADQKELAKIEAAIKKEPDDPVNYVAKAKLQVKMKAYDNGHATAKAAMEKFEKAGDRLAFFILENIEVGSLQVEVRFNMGERERKPPQMGIVRPMTFKLWKSEGKDAKPVEVESIDFEIGMIGGAAETAAFGKTDGEGHHNYGLAEPDATYSQIREKAIALIRKRHPEETKEEEK
jgi:hypothetical protein